MAAGIPRFPIVTGERPEWMARSSPIPPGRSATPDRFSRLSNARARLTGTPRLVWLGWAGKPSLGPEHLHPLGLRHRRLSVWDVDGFSSGNRQDRRGTPGRISAAISEKAARSSAPRTYSPTGGRKVVPSGAAPSPLLLYLASFIVFDPELPGGAQSAGQHLLVRFQQTNVCHPRPAPTARYW